MCHLSLAYGVDLTTLVKMHSTKIPIVVRDCIEELEKRGMYYMYIILTMLHMYHL